MRARPVFKSRLFCVSGALVALWMQSTIDVELLAQTNGERRLRPPHGSQAPGLRAESRSIGIVRGPSGLTRRKGQSKPDSKAVLQSATQSVQPLTQRTFKRLELQQPAALAAQIAPETKHQQTPGGDETVREPRPFIDYAVQSATFNSVKPPLQLLESKEAADMELQLSEQELTAPRGIREPAVEAPALPVSLEVEQTKKTEPLPPTSNEPKRTVAAAETRVEGRRLAPPSRGVLRGGAGTPTEGSSPLAELSWSDIGGDKTGATAAALAVVLGLFLLLMWVWKRAAPKSSRQLPGEVVSVIGRVPLANKQVAQLVKVGNKLLLVNITPEGAETLTEITDPEEVARILADCEQTNPTSASAAFREVFDQLAKEPAYGFLGDEEQMVDRQQLAAAYANTPGGRAYE